MQMQTTTQPQNQISLNIWSGSLSSRMQQKETTRHRKHLNIWSRSHQKEWNMCEGRRRSVISISQVKLNNFVNNSTLLYLFRIKAVFGINGRKGIRVSLEHAKIDFFRNHKNKKISRFFLFYVSRVLRHTNGLCSNIGRLTIDLRREANKSPASTTKHS